MAFRNVHTSLKHDNTEGNPRYPADKEQNSENGEDQKDNAGSPLFAIEVIDRGPQRQNAVQDASDPDKLFRKGTCCHEVRQ